MNVRPGRRCLSVGLVVASCVVVSGARAAHATTDPYWSRQWAPVQIGTPDAWRRTTGAGVRIGVVDTGVDLRHEDLAAKIRASTSCIGAAGVAASCRGSAQDDNGHGTVVSSIAAAVTGNGKGIAGIAPGADLVVARSLTGDGPGGAVGTPADVLAGIDWVVSNGARVVNLSLGDEAQESPGPSALAPAIERAWARGAIPVVAAGNGSSGQAASAYAGLNAVVVGANDRDGSVTPYSLPLRGTKWGLLAPGGAGGDPRGPAFLAQNVVSATWVDGQKDSYGAAGGTSVAAPHVSGALALLLAQGLSREAAIDRLLESVDISRPCGSGCHGRLDIARAIGAQPGSTPKTIGGNGAPGSATPPPAESDGGTQTPDTAVAQPGPAAALPSPPPEPLPIDALDGDASERRVALPPEPGATLRLATSPGSDALVPPGLLMLAVATTISASVVLEWLVRRDRRTLIRPASGLDDHGGGGALRPRAPV